MLHYLFLAIGEWSRKLVAYSAVDFRTLGAFGRCADIILNIFFVSTILAIYRTDAISHKGKQ